VKANGWMTCSAAAGLLLAVLLAVTLLAVWVSVRLRSLFEG
jgi:hypothetical protein